MGAWWERPIAALAATMGLALGCGGGAPARPFDLDVRGFSARAEALLVKLLANDRYLSCGAITPDNALTLPATEQERWDRSSGAERALRFEPVSAPVVVVLAVGLDAQGTVIQQACQELRFEDLTELPGGVLVLVLSRRTGS